MQFTALFFNHELLANEIATKISNAYNCHKDHAQKYEKKDIVAWIDYEVIVSGETMTETWYVSNAESDLSYIRDAMAEPRSSFRETYTDVADFHEALVNVTVVFDKSVYATHWELFKDTYQFNDTSDFPFIQNRRIWRMDKLQNMRGSSGKILLSLSL